MTNELFEKASPESQGVSSAALDRFVSALEDAKFNMHGYMVVKNGKNISDGYVKPFGPDFRHRMYSVSKSFVTGAVGLLIGEGKVALDDPITKFFPEYLPENPDPLLMKATVRDLMKMTSPYRTTTYIRSRGGKFRLDWVRSFFDSPVEKEPGGEYCYDTSGTFICDCMVEKITGKPFLDYMYEKIFREIGIGKDIWCVKSPDGWSWGGSGVMATLPELAKYASVFLHGGKANGKQLLPAWFVKEATTTQVLCPAYEAEAAGEYGYFIWCPRKDCFLFYGMGNQLAFGFPDKDLLFVCYGDDQGPGENEIRQGIKKAVFALADSIGDGSPLPEDPAAYALLEKHNRSLLPKVPDGADDSPTAARISGKWYDTFENHSMILKSKLTFDSDGGKWEFVNASGEGTVEFGIGKHRYFDFPSVMYYDNQIGKPGGKKYPCSAAGRWISENTFRIRVYSLSNFIGNFTADFTFTGDEMDVDFNKHAEWFFDEFEGQIKGYAAF